MPTQREFTRRKGRRTWTQTNRIYRRLTNARGAWVPMFILARVGAGDPQGFCIVHSRIADLRRKGLVIEQQSKWEGGRCKSSYRLVEE